jgi:AraC-like DNA-binding protein
VRAPLAREFRVEDDQATPQICRPARLATVLDHLWHSAGPIQDRRERVLPNGTYELVLALGDRHRVVEDAGVRVLPAASFGGLRSRPLVLDHPDRCDTLGIVLRPAGAYALLGRPLWEVSDLLLDGRDVFGRALDEVAERCAEAGSARARFEHVVRWLTDRIARAKSPDLAVAWMAAEIERRGGNLRVGALHEDASLSRARAVERFRDQIGAPPKLYARLVRFRLVLERLQADDAALSDVALDAGYYDQAHMNAEFRAFAGVSPVAFLAGRYREGSGNTVREPSR